MRDLAKRILGGDTRALARAATIIENRMPEAPALLRELAASKGRAQVVGVTGPPGAGKSTLVDQITKELRAAGRSVGILSVDPSSPFSGGAILGDRIRMQRHHADPAVFIRSMATRGAMGGVARATADLVALLDAAGKDVVLIETVGVGQDEVEIALLADVTVVVLAPGMGDDVQAIKAGIMEIADVYVVNKADLAGAERVEHEIQGLLALAGRPDGWTPPVVRTVASEGTGVAELVAAVRSFYEVGPKKRRAASGVVGGYALDHVGIAVRSIEEALAFWERQAGLGAESIETVPHEKVRVAMLPAGGPRIELLEPDGEDSAIGRFLARRGPGLHHVAIRVPDLDEAAARLRAAGARLLGEPKRGAGGRRYLFVHPASAGGVLLELIQEES